tara:strand:+ start:497 stop:661 length:165 start_codon:yes stop_codon:yes gene_type:complete
VGSKIRGIIDKSDTIGIIENAVWKLEKSINAPTTAGDTADASIDVPNKNPAPEA